MIDKKFRPQAPRVTESGGNVFADLGLPNPEELLQKSNLVIAISRAIDARGFTQSEAAHLMGVNQSDLSTLLRGRTFSFTLDRLVSMLNALGMDVELVVRQRQNPLEEKGQFRVLSVR